MEKVLIINLRSKTHFKKQNKTKTRGFFKGNNTNFVDSCKKINEIIFENKC